MNYSLRKTPTISPIFAAYPLRIGRSRVHGFGVFAASTIPRRRKVIEYTGERIRRREAIRRLWKLLGPRGLTKTYMFALNRIWRIDGAAGGSGAERINHSCNPNLFTRKMKGHILLFARRRIRRGEELSFDYRLHPKTVRVPCRCGSSNCRGFLNRK